MAKDKKSAPPRDRDIVLFLGAGFSRDAGLPTITDFGRFSQEELTKLPEGNQDKNAFPMLHKAGQIFKRFQECCNSKSPEKHPTTVTINPNNMETVFCIAEAMREAEIDPPLEVDADGLIEQIKLWLWQIYVNCPPLDPDRGPETRPDAYEELLRLLNQDEFRKHTTLLTTNYDLLLEYFSWAVPGGRPCDYPLRDQWDYATLQAGPATRGPYVNTHSPGSTHWHESDVLQVCKLHGSVNFFELATSGQARFGICDDVAVRGQMVGNSRIPRCQPRHKSLILEEQLDRRPAIFALDAIWSLRERYGASLVPAIIPPTYAKLQGYPWLRRMWNCAFRAIQNARYLIFIGYGMAPSDGFMRTMFQGAGFSQQEHASAGNLHHQSLRDTARRQANGGRQEAGSVLQGTLSRVG